MCDTIDEEITAETIASQIAIERDAHKGAILIVEGDSDSLFFKRMVDISQCKIIVANGKENALGALELLGPKLVVGVLCIVDADFHHLNVNHVQLNENSIVTDYHDIEVMLFESSSLDKLIDEYGSREKISNLALHGKNIRDMIYQSSVFVGAFRFLSAENGLNLRFKKLKKSDYQFISTSDLSCNIQALISSVKNASKAFDLVDENIVEQIKAVTQRNLDQKQLCCGHDVCAILSRAFSKIIGSGPQNSLSKERVEKNLRIGYEFLYFMSTSLYKSIVLWERKNSTFKILPCINLANCDLP